MKFQVLFGDMVLGWEIKTPTQENSTQEDAALVI